jgi:hypothetical protein
VGVARAQGGLFRPLSDRVAQLSMADGPNLTGGLFQMLLGFVPLIAPGVTGSGLPRPPDR